MAGKQASTAGRKDDPDLAPDAELATDLGDEEERKSKQLEYLGGEIDDDIDNWDPDGLDDGSVIGENAPEPKAEDEEKEDEPEPEKAEEKEEEDDDAEEQPEGVSEDAEEEEDSEDDASDDAESDDDEQAAERTQKAQGIPKSRFDEVNERRKAAEEELARLKAEREAEEKGEEHKFDFDTAEMEYQELLLDGKTEEALAKRKEIRVAERAEFMSEAKNETKSELSTEEMQRSVSDMSTQAEEMFPVFDENHEDYNPVITNKVVTYMRGYVAGGETAPDALVQALADVVEQYGLDERYGISFDEEANEPPPSKENPKPTGKKKTDPGKDKARQKAHQPAAKGGEGSSERGVAVPNIMDMSDEDLDKLSEEQLARMRGDYG